MTALTRPAARAAVVVVLLVGAVAAGVHLLPLLFAGDLGSDFDQAHAADWATAGSCRGCHRSRYTSWHRTFHRTMTQEATPDSVLGRFDGSSYTWWGVTVRPVRRGDRYYFEYYDTAGNHRVTLPVLRTVGSRRYQQYLTQTPNGGDTYFRIHLLWHMEDQRWIHVNGAFLHPDEQDFDNHVAVWNHNCIYCHNTGPVPNIVNYGELRDRELRGEAVNSALEARYDSSVSELGISCEVCHGPGSEHAGRNRNPLRRLALLLSGDDDPTITNPEKLSQQRSVDVCGQCHGQRTPQSTAALHEWITSGPTFRAGEALAGHVQVLRRDTQPPAGLDPDMFRLRFWDDGTPRLSAYEYQGLTQSACFDGGELTCISCHTMHSGDVHGMIPEEHRGNGPCLACHEEIAADVGGHTHHEADGSGSLCYDCHMAKMVYGIMDIHRSHRIEIPDPAADAASGRPNACTNCHLDRSLQWAAEQLQDWFGERYAVPAQRASGASAGVADIVASLHAGDPVQRAVAARLAGREGTPLAARERAFLIPHLLLAMEDNYPSTRNLARKSLLRLDEALRGEGVETGLAQELRHYDFIGDALHRRQKLDAALALWARQPKDGLGLAPPPRGTLLDEDWQPQNPATRELVEIGRARSQHIAIGE